MLHEISFFVPGKPQGKGRPRFTARTGKAMHPYTPRATRLYEKAIREFALVRKIAENWQVTERPLALEIDVLFCIPKSYTKHTRELAEQGLLYPSRPDLDNIVKVILDGLNTLIYADDSQIQRIDARRRYARPHEPEGVKVKVRELSEDAI